MGIFSGKVPSNVRGRVKVVIDLGYKMRTENRRYAKGGPTHSIKFHMMHAT